MKTALNVAITGAAGQIGYALAFRAASGALFDEIRFASTYNGVTGVSAVPEPSSFAALAGLAGLAVAASRRRRA